MDSPATSPTDEIKIPKPLANIYQPSPSATADNRDTEITALGHNTFRSSVYRTDKGY